MSLYLLPNASSFFFNFFFISQCRICLCPEETFPSLPLLASSVCGKISASGNYKTFLYLWESEVRRHDHLHSRVSSPSDISVAGDK